VATTTEPSAETVIPIIAEHIVVTPGVCGGRPRIANHRITVQHVAVWHERGGLSPDEIVARHPGLTLADVYAALAYYHDHRDEVRARIREDERFADELRARSPSLVRQKLAQRDATNDPLPS
jgi:uncharacterized protein (DUF433 family)